MKFESNSSIDILKSAAQREQETRDFYKKCYDEARIKGTRMILKTLVEDEERHYTIVMNLLDEAKSSQYYHVDIPKTVTPEARILSAFTHEVSKGDFSAESATVGVMMKTALANEKESFENYSHAATLTDNREAEAIYEYLAAEENKHYILVSNLIEYLGDPDEWLYEEENLIFRRG